MRLNPHLFISLLPLLLLLNSFTPYSFLPLPLPPLSHLLDIFLSCSSHVNLHLQLFTFISSFFSIFWFPYSFSDHSSDTASASFAHSFYACYYFPFCSLYIYFLLTHSSFTSSFISLHPLFCFFLLHSLPLINSHPPHPAFYTFSFLTSSFLSLSTHFCCFFFPQCFLASFLNSHPPHVLYFPLSQHHIASYFPHLSYLLLLSFPLFPCFFH